MTIGSWVFQAGIGNSGAEHWQSLWAQAMPGAVWVEQEDWDHPDRDSWIAAFTRDAQRAPGPKIVIAHSLGCLVVAEAAAELARVQIAGAFLVAVPDAQGPAFPRSARGFQPALALEMPIPSLVVASADDPYGSLEHARQVADRWGSTLVEIGAKGHVNAKSGLGAWPEGRALLERFAAAL